MERERKRNEKKISFDIVKRFWKWNGTGIWNKEKFGLSLKSGEGKCSRKIWKI